MQRSTYAVDRLGRQAPGEDSPTVGSLHGALLLQRLQVAADGRLGNLEKAAQLCDAGNALLFEQGLDAIVPLGRDQALDHRLPEEESGRRLVDFFLLWRIS